MQQILDFFQLSYFDNTVGAYILTAFFLLLGVVFKRFLSKVSSKLLYEIFKKYALGVTRADFYELIKKPVSLFVLLIFVYIAFSNLKWPGILNLGPKEAFGIKMIVEKLYYVLFIFAVINIFRKMFDFMGIIMVKRAEDKDKKAEKQIIFFVVESLKLSVVIIGVFILLGSVFAINVGTLIAGLGIGGLAVALAAKESLENLMGSFTIFADKPFVTGDLVKVGNTTGVIERVGFRSTRIRTLDKTFVTVPNKLMVDTEVDNLTERTTRRVNFNIGVKYSSSPAHIKNITAAIKVAILEHPDTTDECYVNFASFGSSSLDILVLYYIEGNEFDKFLRVREELNYSVMSIVLENGCDFAFPSTSVYMETEIKQSDL